MSNRRSIRVRVAALERRLARRGERRGVTEMSDEELERLIGIVNPTDDQLLSVSNCERAAKSSECRQN